MFVKLLGLLMQISALLGWLFLAYLDMYYNGANGEVGMIYASVAVLLIAWICCTIRSFKNRYYY